MKFAAIALLATTVSAAALAAKTTCTTADVKTTCNADAADTTNCCGYYLSKDKKTVTRLCGKAAATAFIGKVAADDGTYACTELKVEGASKLALGLSAVAAALYMA
jgi:hypothetical protein